MGPSNYNFNFVNSSPPSGSAPSSTAVKDPKNTKITAIEPTSSVFAPSTTSYTDYSGYNFTYAASSAPQNLTSVSELEDTKVITAAPTSSIFTPPSTSIFTTAAPSFSFYNVATTTATATTAAPIFTFYNFATTAATATATATTTATNTNTNTNTNTDTDTDTDTDTNTNTNTNTTTNPQKSSETPLARYTMSGPAKATAIIGKSGEAEDETMAEQNNKDKKSGEDEEDEMVEDDDQEENTSYGEDKMVEDDDQEENTSDEEDKMAEDGEEANECQYEDTMSDMEDHIEEDENDQDGEESDIVEEDEESGEDESNIVEEDEESGEDESDIVEEDEKSGEDESEEDGGSEVDCSGEENNESEGQSSECEEGSYESESEADENEGVCGSEDTEDEDDEDEDEEEDEDEDEEDEDEEVEVEIEAEEDEDEDEEVEIEIEAEEDEDEDEEDEDEEVEIEIEAEDGKKVTEEVDTRGVKAEVEDAIAGGEAEEKEIREEAGEEVEMATVAQMATRKLAPLRRRLRVSIPSPSVPAAPISAVSTTLTPETITSTAVTAAALSVLSAADTTMASLQTSVAESIASDDSFGEFIIPSEDSWGEFIIPDTSGEAPGYWGDVEEEAPSKEDKRDEMEKEKEEEEESRLLSAAEMVGRKVAKLRVRKPAADFVSATVSASVSASASVSVSAPPPTLTTLADTHILPLRIRAPAFVPPPRFVPTSGLAFAAALIKGETAAARPRPPPVVITGKWVRGRGGPRKEWVWVPEAGKAECRRDEEEKEEEREEKMGEVGRVGERYWSWGSDASEAATAATTTAATTTTETGTSPRKDTPPTSEDVAVPTKVGLDPVSVSEIGTERFRSRSVPFGPLLLVLFGVVAWVSGVVEYLAGNAFRDGLQAVPDAPAWELVAPLETVLLKAVSEVLPVNTGVTILLSVALICAHAVARGRGAAESLGRVFGWAVGAVSGAGVVIRAVVRWRAALAMTTTEGGVAFAPPVKITVVRWEELAVVLCGVVEEVGGEVGGMEGSLPIEFVSTGDIAPAAGMCPRHELGIGAGTRGLGGDVGGSFGLGLFLLGFVVWGSGGKRLRGSREGR
ncbi:hypothetical protein Q9L58_003244 [Maublancomyces gigas]|uniref:Uncharacterized protein n=1 Tax=Discina gigas TaxID=1032678 RepID=A0ABR3GP21_9PEZI